MNQEELDNKLSELRQHIWIELWAINDSSVILENDDAVVIASLKSGNTVKLGYPPELTSEVTPLFLETLRQEFVNAKIIETDYQTLTERVDTALQRIESNLTDDYNLWKDKLNKLIDRINDTSIVLNEQVQRSG